MKRIQLRVINLLSAFLLAVFFMSGATITQPMKVYAQSHEDETTDTEGPVINAAITNGKLRVEAYDESGVKAIYVNDYEFTDVPDGVLSIRLEQFDSGYEQFRLSAIDNLGNMSFDYYIDNPYYSDSEDKSFANELPADAKASGKSEAKAEVTDYTEVAGDDGSAKLFYTFETENGKVFYLIIDRTENSDIVHFVTDVSENDLLNVTSDNSETLPKNSAALDAGIPKTQIPKEEPVVEELTEGSTEDETETEPAEEEPVEKEINEDKPLGTYIVLSVVGAIVIAGAYYFKVVKKKDQFLDEEDDDEFEEIEEIEDDEETGKEDTFFEDTEEDGNE